MAYESYLVVNMLLESVELYVVGQIIEKGRARFFLKDEIGESLRLRHQ